MLSLEQQIFNQIEKSSNILIIFSNRQGEDALSSALALFLFLKKSNLKVDIVGEKTKKTNSFSFLPEYSAISNNLFNLRRFIVSVDISQAKVSQIKYSVDNNKLNFIISPLDGWFKPEDVSSRADQFKYDLIITVGISELESLGEIYDKNIEFFYKTTIINIDNQANNESFGQINFIDLNAASRAEIIFYLLKNKGEELIDEDIATCLLSGIIQKTKNFKSSNLTPRTFLASSELISLKARREEIIANLYRSRDIKTLKLWGRVLNNLQSENEEKLLITKLKIEDFTETEAETENLDAIIDELIINVPQASVVAVFCEQKEEKTKLFLYSLKTINVFDLYSAKAENGNKKSASWLINQDIETASSLIIPELKNKLEKLNS